LTPTKRTWRRPEWQRSAAAFAQAFRGKRRPRFHFTPASEAAPLTVAFVLRGEDHHLTARPGEVEDELHARAMDLAVALKENR
jgi:hypothetical protein